jgi:hypothetical protein
MAGRHWTGEKLPGDAGLPEPGAIPLANDLVLDEAYAPAAIDALLPEAPTATFELLVVVNGVQLEARGESFDAALDHLRTQWAAAQESAPGTLVWDTGRLVEDDDLRLIAEALELYAETHGQALPPSIKASLARLRAAVEP